MIFECGNAGDQYAVALVELNDPVFEGDDAHGVGDAHARLYLGEPVAGSGLVNDYLSVKNRHDSYDSGGGSGIRTHDTVSRIHTFQACAFDRSAIPPSSRRARWSRWRRAAETRSLLSPAEPGAGRRVVDGGGFG